MVTGLKGTEGFQQWVLMSNELVMATCTVNNKETTINKLIENTLTNRSPLQPHNFILWTDGTYVY